MQRTYNLITSVALWGAQSAIVIVIVLGILSTGQTKFDQAVGRPTFAIYLMQIGSLLVIFGETDIIAWVRESSYLTLQFRLFYFTLFLLVGLSLVGDAFSQNIIVAIGGALLLCSLLIFLRSLLLITRSPENPL